ncbi:RDD family protein [Actinomadura rudentiformis]|uniref:RDD family protein n=1 Tax=Actinomadura rudentiformis TaxID=359158 RepID=A0A6H9YNG9_9ACTN|nr:RDD family protein [Actinomadura rudentiformis]KAB2344072.1 RDD family protein [Actinomadura rudentiformis]
MQEQERSPWSDPAYAPSDPAYAPQPGPQGPHGAQPAAPGWTPPVTPAVDGDMAQPGRRLVARLIDIPIATTVAVLLVVGLIQAVPRNADGDPPGAAIAGIFLIIFGTLYLYEGLQLALWGRTLGKRIMKLRVAPATGLWAPLGAGRGLGRAAAYPVLFMFLGVLPLIGVVNLLNTLWLLWDKPLRQCLHDKIARTVVVADATPPRRPLMIPAVLAAVVLLGGTGIAVAVAAPERSTKATGPGGTGAATPGRAVPSISMPPTSLPSWPAEMGGVQPDPRMTTPTGPEFRQIEDACALFPKPVLSRLVPAATGRPGRGTEKWTCAWKSTRDAGKAPKTRITRELTATITIKAAVGQRSATYNAAKQIAQERWWAQNPDKSPAGAWQRGPVRYRDLPGLGDEAFGTYAVQELVGDSGVGTVVVRVRNAVIEVTFKGGSNRLDEFGDEVFGEQRAMPEAAARSGAREFAGAATAALLACTTCTG